ncbi:Hypothetical_protein [Hexamita inflata]|uniref:Hypothetical_protein n=1 Tax=Hexamita inflata TaxID=28002 RepID=A0AA86URB5_9EUKA|nr:Hypothetical protein HINF_LOCUS49171 [Hexamita inflata]
MNYIYYIGNTICCVQRASGLQKICDETTYTTYEKDNRTRHEFTFTLAFAENTQIKIYKYNFELREIKKRFVIQDLNCNLLGTISDEIPDCIKFMRFPNSKCIILNENIMKMLSYDENNKLLKTKQIQLFHYIQTLETIVYQHNGVQITEKGFIINDLELIFGYKNISNVQFIQSQQQLQYISKYEEIKDIKTTITDFYFVSQQNLYLFRVDINNQVYVQPPTLIAQNISSYVVAKSYLIVFSASSCLFQSFDENITSVWIENIISQLNQLSYSFVDVVQINEIEVKQIESSVEEIFVKFEFKQENTIVTGDDQLNDILERIKSQPSRSQK